MRVTALAGTREWAKVIADLPREGPLPCATVIVPRSIVAHALRKEIVRLGRREALAGTLFVSVSALAGEVLANAGRQVRAGEEQLRGARLRALFQTDLPLRYFDLALLREAQGWDVAFARTLGELEAAGLTPDQLKAAARLAETEADGTRFEDVATLWQAADEAAGDSWTRGRILAIAAQELERDATLWSHDGPTLAAVTGHEPVVEARFQLAIPRVQLAGLAARPMRTAFLQQCASTFGADLAEALRGAEPPVPSTTERSLLQSYLFGMGEAVGAKSRKRSRGPDGTVDLEEHAGVEDEIEAAVDWVARLVYEKSVPLEEIGLLLAERDPCAAMLSARLAERGIPCHVSGGVPACSTGVGARALSLVRALRDHLGFEALAEVLPTLRVVAETEEEVRHLSRGEARELAFGLGTVGGSPGHPPGALEWVPRLRARRVSIEAAILAANAVQDDDPRQLARLERQAKALVRIEPALVALMEVARASVERAPLSTLGPQVVGFLSEWLLAPGSGAAVLASLVARMTAVASDPSAGSLVGDDALAVLTQMVWEERVPVGRWGDASVHIDTIVRAAGLPFRAVRMLGLAEGTLPSPPREDAVLPERLRARLGVPGLARSGRATAQLHGVDRVVREVGETIVFSAPRLSADRVYREPSSLFIELATALGRPNSTTGQYESPVPTGRSLRRDGFLPARQSAVAFRHGQPLSEGSWQSRAASLCEGLTNVRPDDPTIAPARWAAAAFIDLGRVAALRSASFGALDGLLGKAALGLLLPGLSHERALSASALARLLECPHRFLYERGFGWYEPADAPNAREFDALSFGTLFHAVAERFFVAHGEAFGARGGKLSQWHALADRLADEAFDEFLEEYPLTGDAVRISQRERLRADLRAMLEHEHGEPEARFIEAERSFGTGEPLAWPTAGGPLYLVGYIDRVDVVGRTTRVRDLKTGKAHARRAGDAPEPQRDVQIALYALVAEHLAKGWKLPARVSAQYLYANARGVELRDWEGDMDTLLVAARAWLELAGELLRSGNLPRTPDGADCTYCPFTAVCGEERNTRAGNLLGVRKDLATFRVLKEGD